MEVTPVDVHDDALLREYWRVGRDGDAFGRPYAAFYSYDDMVMQLRDANPARKVTHWVATEGGRLLGGGPLVLPLLDNTRLAYAEPIVAPQFRNRGVGSALLDVVLEAAARHGRSTVVIEAAKPLDAKTSPAWSFLLNRGFSAALVDLHRVLELPVPAARLTELADEAAPHCAAYRLVTWQGATPGEWVAGLCELQAAFNLEAPSGDLDLEPEAWDEKRLRDRERRDVAQGRTQTTTLAVAPDCRVVALTEMLMTSHGSGPVFQGGTLVLPEHRGHRLGIATKVANLRRFQATFPEAKLVHSWNAEENGPMVRINDALGFRAVEHLAEMQRKL